MTRARLLLLAALLTACPTEPEPDPTPTPAPPPFAVSELRAQWTETAPAILVGAVGVTEAEAPAVAELRLVADPTELVALDLDLGVAAIEGSSWSFVVELPANRSYDTLAPELRLRVRGAEGDSEWATAAVGAPGGAGDPCVATETAASSCVRPSWCRADPEGSPFGTCADAPGDPPALASASIAEVEPNAEGCPPDAPHRVAPAFAGEASLPVIAVLLGDAPGELDLAAGGFETTASLCVPGLPLDPPPPVAVRDAAGRLSPPVDPSFLGSPEDAPCAPELRGQCAPGSHCPVESGLCAPISLVGGDCFDPEPLLEDTLWLQTAGLLSVFDGRACLDDTPTLGADRVFSVELEPGETLSATARSGSESPALYLLDEACARTPRTCLDADRAGPGDEATASWTNPGPEPRTVHVVVDAVASSPSAATPPYELTLARSADGSLCPSDAACSETGGRKLNLVLVLDYSVSMNSLWNGSQTRWQALLAGIEELFSVQAGLLRDRTHVAMLRFGHDPAPSSPGTPIPNETTGLVDGQAVDLLFSDPLGEPATYRACAGDDAADLLAATLPPMGGNQFGIGTWTKGALDRAAQLIEEDRAARPVVPERAYAVLLVTDGQWTGANGLTTLSPASEHPGLAAADLLDDQGAPTFVLELSGDIDSRAAADEIAAAGGTTSALTTFTAAASALAGLCVAQ